MKPFHDSKGRSWDVSVSVASLLRVKDLCELDLTELSKGNPPVGVRITTEPLLFGRVIYAVCRPQAEANKVSEDDFLGALEGEALAQAFGVFCDEITNFFRKTGRAEQATVLEKQMQVLSLTVEKARKQLEAIETEQLVDAAISAASGKSATSSPASSE